MLDETKWQSALAHFDAFLSELPRCPAEDDVLRYHDVIDGFEQAGETNLSQFRILPERLSFATPPLPGWQTRHPQKSSVDPQYFHQQVRRLIEYLKASLDFE